jgi:hypothetical protein
LITPTPPSFSLDSSSLSQLEVYRMSRSNHNGSHEVENKLVESKYELRKAQNTILELKGETSYHIRVFFSIKGLAPPPPPHTHTSPASMRLTSIFLSPCVQVQQLQNPIQRVLRPHLFGSRAMASQSKSQNPYFVEPLLVSWIPTELITRRSSCVTVSSIDLIQNMDSSWQALWMSTFNSQWMGTNPL